MVKTYEALHVQHHGQCKLRSERPAIFSTMDSARLVLALPATPLTSRAADSLLERVGGGGRGVGGSAVLHPNSLQTASHRGSPLPHTPSGCCHASAACLCANAPPLAPETANRRTEKGECACVYVCVHVYVRVCVWG